jgi:acetyl-CoA carboxylase carboxyl transferase subunit alpha
MDAFFEFEKPISNLERKLQDLRDLARQEGVDFSHEIEVLEKRLDRLIDETTAKLTPWQRVQLSRHPSRPYTRDYVDAIFPGFMELCGDRAFGEDQAILGGIALWPPIDPRNPPAQMPTEDTPGTIPVLILGHQKGRTTKERMERNFGMARPEGYRKAMRLMELAERSRMPVITLIDTPGAYPGIDAEERGQSQAIAESIHKMFNLSVPVLSLVIGEGGSGGALALGIGDQVLMQEFSVYSVISPESCASILWNDSSLAERAAEKLKMNPNDLHRMGVIDGIVPEPKGGAHRDWPGTFSLTRKTLLESFGPIIEAFLQAEARQDEARKKGTGNSPAEKPKRGEKNKKKAEKSHFDLRLSRHEKFRTLGNFAIADASNGTSR